MYYKLSNVAKVEEMECVFDAEFKYPDLHIKDPIINGLEESLLPIITNEQPDKIQFGIWGKLPEGYKEDWSVYQETLNTLNTDTTTWDKSQEGIVLEKRCMIIVSGYYLTYIYKGEVYPFYTYPRSKQPFAIAGVYNVTYDGFITFSLLLTSINSKVSKFHNTSTKMPLVLTPSSQDQWMSKDYKRVLNLKPNHDDVLDFQSHPISRLFYKNNISYDSFLNPTHYESLVIPF